MTRFSFACTILMAASSAFAGESKFAKDFQPQAVTFPAGEITLKDALAILEKQTGNSVTDLRKVHLNNPKVKLKTGSFWQTLDTLGNEQGIGFSPYYADGAIALIDSPYRKQTTHISGPFRFAVKRLSVTRDDETQTHYGLLSLEVAWEPRIQPLYLGLQRGAATLGKETQSIERQTMKSITGPGATEIELRLNAPDRKVLKIDSVQGMLRMIAAPKMLEFKFDNIRPKKGEKPREAKAQEGVMVSQFEVTQKQVGEPWKVKLLLTYSEGAVVPHELFESHQFWNNNNRVWLTWTDPVTKQVRTLEASESYETVKGGMRVTMAFAPSDTTPFPPANAQATLHFRTPSRVAEVMVPFEFRDLPLP